MSVRYGVDQRVKVKRWQVRVFCLDVNHRGGVVPREVYVEGERIVEVRECDSILGTDRLTDYDLVDVVELVPIFITTQTQRASNCYTDSWSGYF